MALSSDPRCLVSCRCASCDCDMFLGQFDLDLIMFCPTCGNFEKLCSLKFFESCFYTDHPMFCTHEKFDLEHLDFYKIVLTKHLF